MIRALLRHERAEANGSITGSYPTGARPEFLRLPRPGERCPVTGLSRTTLNELTIPSAANGNRPPVRSVVLRKRGASRGIRLVDFESLTSYLHGLASVEGDDEETPSQ